MAQGARTGIQESLFVANVLRGYWSLYVLQFCHFLYNFIRIVNELSKPGPQPLGKGKEKKYSALHRGVFCGSLTIESRNVGRHLIPGQCSNRCVNKAWSFSVWARHYLCINRFQSPAGEPRFNNKSICIMHILGCQTDSSLLRRQRAETNSAHNTWCHWDKLSYKEIFRGIALHRAQFLQGFCIMHNPIGRLEMV